MQYFPRSLALVAGVVAVCVLRGSPVVSQALAIDDVVQRASIYATEFRRRLSNLVAEEIYVQDMRSPMGISILTDGKGSEPVRHRELKSDLLMVRPGERYVEFRDVFEVDGRAIRDRQNRLTDLFLSDKNNAEQVERIAQDSARFNIGNVYRNINTPTLALVFLEPEQRIRFRFRRVDASQRPALARDWTFVDAGAEANLWVVEYRETAARTIIRRFGGNGDMPATGRFWIDGPSGRILASELVVGDPTLQCTVDVRYSAEQLQGLLIPAEMRERYVNNRERVTTTGTATYGKVRRFGVTSNEDIPPVR